jgi:hypothetical protein
MELTFTSEEREFLMEVLEQHHHELLREISRASHREFRLALKNKEQLLCSTVTKLQAAQESALQAA